MIHEYAILPGVFEECSYESPAMCDMSLSWLKDGLLHSGIVRNLHDGGWEKCLLENRESLHMRGKELLKKLGQQNRLSSACCELENAPKDNAGWFEESQKSHDRESLDAIIVSDAYKKIHRKNSHAISVQKLSSFTNWCGKVQSLPIKRDSGSYIAALGTLLKTANSLTLIDAHLDPSEPRYDSVKELIRHCKGRKVKPLVEIHRVAYKGSGPNRTFPDWEEIFNDELGSLREFADCIEVSIWDDFHDRALITNLVGILMPNGFDVDDRTMTTWGKLSRESIDLISSEFVPTFSPHKLMKSFRIGSAR